MRGEACGWAGQQAEFSHSWKLPAGSPRAGSILAQWDKSLELGREPLRPASPRLRRVGGLWLAIGLPCLGACTHCGPIMLVRGV
jgi:hypothetical protein